MREPQGLPRAARAGKMSLPRISAENVARTARELVAAYGPAAGVLMRKRMRSVGRRGDAETATLWQAVARAVERELGSGAAEPMNAATTKVTAIT